MKIAGFDVKKECPKMMLNGPCGGVSKGMCEVSGACVWVKIYAKLKSDKKLHEFVEIRMPKVSG